MRSYFSSFVREGRVVDAAMTVVQLSVAAGKKIKCGCGKMIDSLNLQMQLYFIRRWRRCVEEYKQSTKHKSQSMNHKQQTKYEIQHNKHN